MKLSIRLFFAVLFALYVSQTHAKVELESDGKKMLGDMYAKVKNIISTSKSLQETERRFRPLMYQHFDSVVIGRWVVGRQWRTATKKQQIRYMEAFHAYMLRTYTIQLSKFRGLNFKVVGAEGVGHTVVVISKIVKHDGSAVTVKWRLVESKKKFKVRDIVVDNISMSLNYRREFNSVYIKRGGTFEGLIQALEEKVDQLGKLMN